MRHSWDVWGNRLGTLNRVTDATALHALATARTGRRVSLDAPLTLFDPPLYGRTPLEHRVFDRNRNMVEDEIGHLDPQASSQWDSLRHIRARQHGHYGGLAADDPAVAELGIDTVARHGLVLRGVLVDLPRWWAATRQDVDPFTDHAITVDDVDRALSYQDTRARDGDLLLVRTGWLERYRRTGIAAENLTMPPAAGLHAGEDTARFLWDSGFCAVAADNPAVENLPGDPAVGSLHRRLIPALGMPLGELWDLDTLAETGRYEVCVVSVPLNVPGGVASPANAMAVL